MSNLDHGPILDDGNGAPDTESSPRGEVSLQYSGGGPHGSVALLGDDDGEIVLDDFSKSMTIRERLLEREYAVNIRAWYIEAWRLYRLHWMYFVGWAFVAAIPTALSLVFPPIAILFIPLLAGLIVAVNNLTRTTAMREKPYLIDFLQGFRMILPVMAVYLLQLAAIAVGLVVLILPGIYLLVALSFALHLSLEFRQADIGIFDSLLISERVVRKRWWRMAGFYFLTLLLTAVGIASVLGMLVLLPLGQIAMAVAFKDVFGLLDHHQFAVETEQPS